MKISRIVPSYGIVFCLILTTCIAESAGADKNAIEWLRGTGNDLELRLSGDVFENDGSPADQVSMVGKLLSHTGNRELKPDVQGNHFEIWLPVNQKDWYYMQLSVSTARNDSVAYLKITASELRKSIVDGVKLTLKPPTRQVELRVTDHGHPVSDANVKMEIEYGIDIRSRTNESGIARFLLLPNLTISGVSAWTDDYRIGGYSFDRKPVRDPTLNQHLIELSPCRDQKFRFVDQQGSAVPGIEFLLRIATAGPNFNFIGSNEHSIVKTDANGEVIYKWFPEWNSHFYVDLHTDQWIIDGNVVENDDVKVYTLKKSRIASRRRITGRVKTTRSKAGGFQVQLNSFQGERKGRGDGLMAFTDADGSFSVDVLPDAKYCIHVQDGRWVGNVIDLIPYESQTDRINSPLLTIAEGQDVEVIVTSGSSQRPYPHVQLEFQRPHKYQFLQDGKLRHGNGGPRWWSTTDDTGRVVTKTLPGELNVSLYTPLWRTQKTVMVKEGEPVTIYLHREIDEKQTVSGQLLLPSGVDVTLKDAQITIGSVDVTTPEEFHLTTTDQDGRFQFETLSAHVGIIAKTKDGLYAGGRDVNEFAEPIEIVLASTTNFHGKLINRYDEPIASRRVRATASVEVKQGEAANVFLTRVSSKEVEALTDQTGNFVLQHVPTNLVTQVWADGVDGAASSHFVVQFSLLPVEARTQETFRLKNDPKVQTPRPLAERYRTALRDCELNGYHLMLIVCDEDLSVTTFVNKHMRDYETNVDNSAYIPLEVLGNEKTLNADDLAFLKEKTWPQPGDGRVFACALDGRGNVLGRLEFTVADENAASAVAEFVHQHVPAKRDAEKAWNDAFAEAKRSNRRVWARISQRYCSPCFQLSRWLDDQRETLEKDFVLLNVDDVGEVNSVNVAKRITGNTNHGAPFSAIYDANAELLTDSAGPIGNVGFPSGTEGKKRLRQMLLNSRANLTDAEINALVQSIDGLAGGQADR